MPLRNPEASRFQISIRARIPRGKRIANALASEIARTWIETGEAPTGFDVRLIIWRGHHKREIDSLGDDPRGLSLRHFLSVSLRQRRLVIKEMGNRR